MTKTSQEINFDLERGLRNAYLPSGALRMAVTDLGNRQIKISGALLQPNLFPRRYEITLDDRAIPGQQTHLPSPKLLDMITPYYVLDSGFEAVVEDVDLRQLEKTYRFSARAVDGTHAFAWYQDSWLGPSWGALPTPDVMKRVGIPNGDIPNSLMTGASFHYKLRALTQRYMQRDLLSLDAILDWGCGYGRLIRFFPPEVRSNVYGADIDPINIEWARQSQPDFTFVHAPMQPPTPFDAGMFDLVYGGSVFSHLAEDDQFAWLAELQRITKPGGCVAVTVHARQSFVFLPPVFHGGTLAHALVTKGFNCSDKANPDLLDVAGEFYTDAHHNHHYILLHWSRYFDVLDILEGFYGNQAMVILRRRPD